VRKITISSAVTIVGQEKLAKLARCLLVVVVLGHGVFWETWLSLREFSLVLSEEILLLLLNLRLLLFIVLVSLRFGAILTSD